MKRCLKRGIPVTMLSRRGRYYGRLATTSHTSGEIVRAQCAAADDDQTRFELAQALIAAKIKGSRRLLRQRKRRMPHGEKRDAVARAGRQLKTAFQGLTEADSLDSLRGMEGTAAAVGFGVLNHLIRARGMSFHGRSKRPPQDEINALLSLAYTLAHTKLFALVEMHRLHPFIGFLHAERPGHATLVSDLIEPFRPALDRFVLTIVNRGQMSAEDFEYRDGGCFLRQEALPNFLDAFERAFRRPMAPSSETPKSAKPSSLWRAMLRQTTSLVRALQGQAPSFRPYVFR
jgi:CRISPR-associated protein Cas1